MDDERSMEEWLAKRAELAAQEALLDTKTYAIEKDGFVSPDTYDDSGKYAGRHKLSGLPVRRVSIEEQQTDDYYASKHSAGFIEGFVRERKTKNKVTITRNGETFSYLDVVIEQGGARTSAFEVHRWWAKQDEEGKTPPMTTVTPEQMTPPEDMDTPYDVVLFDPKPSGGRGYTISRHGRIPGPDPVHGPERESLTLSNGPRLPDVGISHQDVMCECHHKAGKHEEVPGSNICWATDCDCQGFKRMERK